MFPLMLTLFVRPRASSVKAVTFPLGSVVMVVSIELLLDVVA